MTSIKSIPKHIFKKVRKSTRTIRKHIIKHSKYVYISFGENCVMDDILKRFRLKTFSTPFSANRCNVEQILMLEKENYKHLLDPKYLYYENTNGVVTVRNKHYCSYTNKYDSYCQDFEFTHHDVISNNNDKLSYSRKISRLNLIQSKKVYIFYYNRLCADTDNDLLIHNLNELYSIYQKKCLDVHIILFQQVIINNDLERHVEHIKKDNVDVFYLFSTHRWSGEKKEYFWGKCDDDLIKQCFKIIKSKSFRN